MADAEGNIQLNNEAFFTKWAEYTVDRLKEALLKYQRSDWTMALLYSITTEVKAANGDVDVVIIKFLQYGRFIDMGVGRGVPVGAAGSGAFSAARDSQGKLKSYRRRPERWYSGTYFTEVQKVQRLYQEMFNNEIPVAIKEALTNEVTISAL